MNCKKCFINYMKPERLMTELRFNIASARASGFELIKIEFPKDDAPDAEKLVSSVLKKLRLLKKEGVVQFFANNDSFERHATEAVYLLNKYPEIASDESLTDSAGQVVFIRL